jgi:hypothetical protein
MFMKKTAIVMLMALIVATVQGCTLLSSCSEPDAAMSTATTVALTRDDAILAATEAAMSNGYDVNGTTIFAKFVPGAKLWIITFNLPRRPTPPGTIVADGVLLAEVFLNAETGKLIEFMVGP